MNNFLDIMNRLSDLNEYGLNRDRLPKEERAYTLLTTNLTMFQGVVNEYGSESEFARAYGISNLIYSVNNDLVRIYIPKESLSADIRQLMKDLDASVIEYYGVVQFDGTEPEARGEYVFDPVIQMSNRVINDFKGTTSNDSDSQEDSSDNNSEEEKPKRKLYKLIKKSDRESSKEDNEQNDEEESDELDSSEEQEETDDNSEEDQSDEEPEDNEEEIESNEESQEDDSEEQDNDFESDETEEDNTEDNEDNDNETNSSDKNSRAYFMKGVKDPEEDQTDEEGTTEEDNIEDEEDPDSVDEFFDDEEVEGSLEKKSNEIEKDLSRELDKRIEDEKAKKKEEKKFSKLKKKEKAKKESIEVSSIPSSRLANMDLLKSLASEPIEYSNLGFNDYDRIEKIIQKSMMTKDEFKRRKLKRKKIY